MTTMSDVVTGALRRLRVVTFRRQPDGAAATAGLDALNKMMLAWKANGVDVAHGDYVAGDDFPLDAEHVQGVIALLAVRLSSDYGKEVDAAVVRDAELGWLGLQAEFVPAAETAKVETGLTAVGRRWGYT